MHTDLEEQLEARYGLLEAVVVDAEEDEQDVLAALGSAGAGYLETTLTGGERLGISSWSATLLGVADRLHPFRTPGAESIIQLVGGVGVASVQAEANRLLASSPRWSGPARPSCPPRVWSVAGRARRRSCGTRPWGRSPASGGS